MTMSTIDRTDAYDNGSPPPIDATASPPPLDPAAFQAEMDQLAAEYDAFVSAAFHAALGGVS